MHFFRFQLLAVLASPLTHNALAFSNLHHGSQHQHNAHQPGKRLLGLFNSDDGPIEVSGEHEWRAPGPGDQRGPCPGLNALANHGYIARDGIATLLGVVDAMNKVYGISVELATLLSVMGVVWTGNLISLSPSFSIGGNDTDVQNLLGNVLGLLGVYFRSQVAGSTDIEGSR